MAKSISQLFIFVFKRNQTLKFCEISSEGIFSRLTYCNRKFVVMIRYEPKTIDKSTFRNGASKIMYSLWSLPIWMPLSILYILISLAPDGTILSLIQNWVTRARNWDQDTLGLFKMYFLLTLGHWAIPFYNGWNKSSGNHSIEPYFDPIEPIVRPITPIVHRIKPNFTPNELIDVVPADEMQKILAKIQKDNEYNEAFKYLCTCNPGNEILSRKPIRIGDMKLIENYEEDIGIVKIITKRVDRTLDIWMSFKE